MHRNIRFACAVLLVLCSATVGRAIPPLMNCQGLLSDNGTPITTPTSVEFRLYDMRTGGTALWMETQSVTPDNQGRFTALLGSGTPLPPAAIAMDSTFLGITISPNPEIVPRLQLAAGAYAFRVGTIDGAAGGTVTGDVLISGKATIGAGNANTGIRAFVAGENNSADGDFSVLGGGMDFTQPSAAASRTRRMGTGTQSQADNPTAPTRPTPRLEADSAIRQAVFDRRSAVDTTTRLRVEQTTRPYPAGDRTLSPVRIRGWAGGDSIGFEASIPLYAAAAAPSRRTAMRPVATMRLSAADGATSPAAITRLLRAGTTTSPPVRIRSPEDTMQRRLRTASLFGPTPQVQTHLTLFTDKTPLTYVPMAASSSPPERWDSAALSVQDSTLAQRPGQPFPIAL